MTTSGILYEWTCDGAPLQAEGMIDGNPFYFRSRGNYWSVGIGGEPVCDPAWEYGEDYGAEAFDASWMPKEIGAAFIAKAADMWRAQQ